MMGCAPKHKLSDTAPPSPKCEEEKPIKHNTLRDGEGTRRVRHKIQEPMIDRNITRKETTESSLDGTMRQVSLFEIDGLRKIELHTLQLRYVIRVNLSERPADNVQTHTAVGSADVLQNSSGLADRAPSILTHEGAAVSVHHLVVMAPSGQELQRIHMLL